MVPWCQTFDAPFAYFFGQYFVWELDVAAEAEGNWEIEGLRDLGEFWGFGNMRDFLFCFFFYAFFVLDCF